MLLSDKLLHYLDSSSKVLDCGIIITDLSKIIYANTSSIYSYFDSIQECNYIYKKISKELNKIIFKWSNFDCYNDSLYKIYNNYYTEKNHKSILKLVEDDNSLYLAQSILPIFNNDNLEGLFICFRNNRHYIDSNIKPIRTTRNCIENFIKNNYTLGVS